MNGDTKTGKIPKENHQNSQGNTLYYRTQKEVKEMTYFNELEADQIESACPDCGSDCISRKNWTSKGRGTHVMRVFLFRCPDKGCGRSFRRARSERPEDVETE